MNRYPGAPPNVGPGQSLPSVGGYPPGMPGHMPSPQTVPPYNVAVASPSQYGQQPVPGPSPTQTHYTHQSVIELSRLKFSSCCYSDKQINECFFYFFSLNNR